MDRSSPLFRLLALSLFCGGLLGCPPAAEEGPGGTTTGEQPVATEDRTPEQPVKTPEAKPFNRDTLTTPWKNAKVGDYVVYKFHKPRMMTFRFEVTEVAEKTITWEQKDAQGALRNTVVVDLVDEEERFQEPESLDAVESVAEQHMDIGDKHLDVKVVKRSYGGGATETWIAKVLPPFVAGAGGTAVVKSIKDGELINEVIEFGGAE